MKTNGKTITAATADYGNTTCGEVFADGRMMELIGGAHLGNPQLMLWDSSTELMAPALEYNGQRYEPVEIERSVLQQLMPRRAVARTGPLANSWRKLAQSLRILLGWMKSLLPSQLESCSAAQSLTPFQLRRYS